MTEEQITVDNCTEIMHRQKFSNESQAQAWCVIHHLCIQLGLPPYPEDEHLCGIEKTVKFITAISKDRDYYKELAEKLQSEKSIRFKVISPDKSDWYGTFKTKKEATDHMKIVYPNDPYEIIEV